MNDGMYVYFPECITAVEMETTEAIVRVDTSEDSLGLIRVIPKPKAGNDLAELVDGCITFNPIFCAQIFDFLGQHCEHFRGRADAELAERKGPEVVKVIEQDVSESLQRFALK